jgi:hypothetical protein
LVTIKETTPTQDRSPFSTRLPVAARRPDRALAPRSKRLEEIAGANAKMGRLDELLTSVQPAHYPRVAE